MSYSRAKLALAGTRFSDIRHVAETGSTNVDMRELIRAAAVPSEPGNANAADPAAVIVLVADHQSAGRGRLDRDWQAPSGSSILMTVGLPVAHIAPSGRTLLTMCLSLAVMDALAALGIGAVSLKWPNDVIVVDGARGADDGPSPLGYRKLGGVLAELVEYAPGHPYVILGIGLNVNWGVIPPELADVAASLDGLAGAELDRWDLLVRILEGFDRRWLPQLEADDRATLIAAYSELCATLGEKVRIELGDGVLVGTATAVTDTGALVVTGEGTRHVITAGDLVHLRPG